MTVIIDQLKSLGLQASEIKVYLYLLEKGVSTPPSLAQGIGMQRTNAYSVLKKLKDKGLIAEQLKGRRKIYFARDPQALLLSLDQKKEAARKLLPDLRALFAAQKNKPSIRFFEGWNEVKEIYLETLASSKVIAIGSTLQMSKIDQKFTKNYQRELAKRKIIFYDILTASSKSTLPQIKSFLGGLHEAKFLPAKHQDLPTDILLWENNIAIITLEKPIFGTILANPLLAESFRVIFEILWERL